MCVSRMGDGGGADAEWGKGGGVINLGNFLLGYTSGYRPVNFPQMPS